MCKTRIKIIDEYVDCIEYIEDSVNQFISDPENKVAKVNSIETEIYYDDDDDPYMIAVINYELGD